ncbi:MAG: AEC family transporter [Calditerrivibrio sp.]|nr:AEC family transporter [Calditerrivibrio sp.]
MSQYLPIIINQVILFALLMLIGFIAAKTKVITEDGLGHLARFIVKIILPCLIFSVVAGSGVSKNDMIKSFRFALAVTIMFISLPLIGFVIAKITNLKDTSFNVFIPLITFGNMGFIGIPLINEVYKDPLTGISITIYTLIDMTLLWTFGVYMCSRHQGSNSIKDSIKNMINPTTISLFLALVVLLLNIKIPKVLSDTVYGIGGTSKYLTMIYLGATLSFINPKGVFTHIHSYLLVLTKMIILPVLLFGLFKNILPEVQRGILSIVAGLPTMTTVVMLAKTYRSDDKLATETIFFTTIACLFTIPLVSIINSYLWR